MDIIESEILEALTNGQALARHQYIDFDTRAPVVEVDEVRLMGLATQSDKSIVGSLLKYINHETYKSLRLCSRFWEGNIAVLKPPKFPAVYMLPRELIQHIFFLLCPSDANAARQTCHAWYMASIDRYVLHAMLQRGGWFTGAVTESRALHIEGETPQNKLCQPGFLSKCFARECALLPAWRGVMLEHSSNETTWQDTDTPPVLSSALVLTSLTDMTELTGGGIPARSELGCGLSFTVSVCGFFLLAADGCIIYVYELNGSDVQHYTTVVCPRRVLAVSMDTSAERYSLAALLDSRMGVVCDLEAELLQKDTPLSPAPASSDSMESESMEQGIETASADAAELPTQSNKEEEHSLQDSTSPSLSRGISGVHIRSPGRSVSLFNASEESEVRTVNQTWPRFLPSGRLSVYNSLCSPDDPPRSVAICPIRRCLAFGCSAGIELHWVDALTGKNLMKWFPLTATSDFLYFLPRREGIDSPNKLRLISSKAGPGQRSGIDRYAKKGRRGRRYGLDWGNGLRENDYDHFAAVPISDGSHILFTDPMTGRLYLGSDTPLVGPTKLLRKVIFIPPAGIVTSKDEPPSVYAAGLDLSWGIRVVAVYGKCIILYCLPPDVFADIKNVNVNPSAPADQSNEEREFGIWREWWDFSEHPKSKFPITDEQDFPWTGKSSPVTPIKMPIPVHGSLVDCAPGLVDVAVQNSRELAIWGFSASGMVRTWELGDKSDMTVRFASKDGSITESLRHGQGQKTVLLDQDGDVIMGNTCFSYDGACEIGIDKDLNMAGVMPDNEGKRDGTNKMGTVKMGSINSSYAGLCNFDAGGKARMTRPIDEVAVGDVEMVDAPSSNRRTRHQSHKQLRVQLRQMATLAACSLTLAPPFAKKTCPTACRESKTVLQQVHQDHDCASLIQRVFSELWSTNTACSSCSVVKSFRWQTMVGEQAAGDNVHL